MQETIAQFVQGLPTDVRTMTHLLQRNELDALRRLVHQLHGASGGYGFAVVTEPATRIEESIIASENFQTITGHVNSLIQTLRRIEGFDESVERAAAQSQT